MLAHCITSASACNIDLMVIIPCNCSGHMVQSTHIHNMC